MNRFVFLNLPMLSLEAHLGVTASPHTPFPTGYVTPLVYSGSPPLRLSSFHSKGRAFLVNPPYSRSECIPDMLGFR